MGEILNTSPPHAYYTAGIPLIAIYMKTNVSCSHIMLGGYHDTLLHNNNSVCTTMTAEKGLAVMRIRIQMYTHMTLYQ